MHGLVNFKVLHTRHVPLKYSFLHRFFWFKIDLTADEKWPSFLCSMNKFNLYSFFDKDHIKLGKSSAKENYIEFARQNGVTEKISEVVIYTQMRFLGYVFNPVSFIFLRDVKGVEYAIVEIGNTFNELKPYFVGPDKFDKEIITFQTTKYFYISPFIAHDNEMKFVIKRNEEKLNIYIEDFKEQKVLQVWFWGKHNEASSWNLFKATLFMPFVTFRIISLIHWHALKLWLKGVKFYKKSDNPELQKETMVWKA